MSVVLYRGSAESTLDDKGRVNIPVRFREHFQGELIITRGQNYCAMILKPSAWERLEKAEENSDVFNNEDREIFSNWYLNEASSVELDNVGRIAIPPRIRKYAKLTRNCIVIRDKDRLFIWDSEVYEAYLEENAAVARSAMNKLGSQDIFGVK